jgi:hypothetical protein
MPSTERSTHITLEVLDTRLDHLQEMLKQVLERQEKAATRDEVAELRTELKTEVAERKTVDTAHDTRMRAVEEDRIAARAIIAVAGFLGLGGLGLIARALFG